MHGFISKSEVIKRTGKFQAFGECLHDVALIGNEFLMDFYGDRERKDKLKLEPGDKATRKGKGGSAPVAHVCGILHQYGKR